MKFKRGASHASGGVILSQSPEAFGQILKAGSLRRKTIPACVHALFESCRSQVTHQDIRDYSPGDPGYGNYVHLWSRILETGIPPVEPEFDLSEVISLTRWGDVSHVRHRGNFLTYRRFVSSVGVALLHAGNTSDCVGAANYLAHDLISDFDMADAEHLALLRTIFPSTRELLVTSNGENEYPFFTFGSLILAQMDADWKGAADEAKRLIDDDASVRANPALNNYVENERFLLGLTNYSQMHDKWLEFAARLTNPEGNMDIQLIIDAMAHMPLDGEAFSRRG